MSFTRPREQLFYNVAHFGNEEVFNGEVGPMCDFLNGVRERCARVRKQAFLDELAADCSVRAHYISLHEQLRRHFVAEHAEGNVGPCMTKFECTWLARWYDFCEFYKGDEEALVKDIRERIDDEWSAVGADTLRFHFTRYGHQLYVGLYVSINKK